MLKSIIVSSLVRSCKLVPFLYFHIVNVHFIRILRTGVLSNYININNALEDRKRVFMSSIL